MIPWIRLSYNIIKIVQINLIRLHRNNAFFWFGTNLIIFNMNWTCLSVKVQQDLTCWVMFVRQQNHFNPLSLPTNNKQGCFFLWPIVCYINTFLSFFLTDNSESLHLPVMDSSLPWTLCCPFSFQDKKKKTASEMPDISKTFQLFLKIHLGQGYDPTSKDVLDSWHMA